MIYKLTRLSVADNTGAKEVMCIGHLKNKKRSNIGDIITVSIKSIYPNASVERKKVAKAMIIRTKSGYNRGNVRIRFADNAVVMMEPNMKKPLGNRVSGASIYELNKYSIEVYKLIKKVLLT